MPTNNSGSRATSQTNFNLWRLLTKAVKATLVVLPFLNIRSWGAIATKVPSNSPSSQKMDGNYSAISTNLINFGVDHFEENHDGSYQDKNSKKQLIGMEVIQGLFGRDQYITPPSDVIDPEVMDFLKQGYYLRFPSSAYFGPAKNPVRHSPANANGLNEKIIHHPEHGRLFVRYISDTHFEFYNLTFINSRLKLELVRSFNEPKKPGFFQTFLYDVYLDRPSKKDRKVISEFKLINPNNFDTVVIEQPYFGLDYQTNDNTFFKESSLNQLKSKNPPAANLLTLINKKIRKIQDLNYPDTDKKSLQSFLKTISDQIADAGSSITSFEKIVNDFEIMYEQVTSKMRANIPEDLLAVKQKIFDFIETLKNPKESYSAKTADFSP